jgi:subtilase family serine protease
VTRYYFSVNATLDATDPLLGARDVNAVDPGSVSAATSSVTIPASAATGVYYIFANADDFHSLTEMSETNNARKVTINVGPDLTVSAVNASASQPGGAISITDSTQNAGGGGAAATVTSFYLSVNSVWDAADIFLGTRAVPALAAGGVSTETNPFSVPASTPVGTYYVLAKADHGSAVLELSETNNVKGVASIKIGADLVVVTLTSPTTVVRGTPFTVGDTTRTDGGAAVDTTTSYYLSTDKNWDAGDVLLGSRSVGALLAGASGTGQATIVIPAGQAIGNYYVLAKADSANVAVEISETNNLKANSIRVNP